VPMHPCKSTLGNIWLECLRPPCHFRQQVWHSVTPHIFPFGIFYSRHQEEKTLKINKVWTNISNSTYTVHQTPERPARLNFILLKGTVPRDFRLQGWLWISFSQAPEYTIRTVSNYLENSRRYSQIKVHHQCRWHLWQMKQNLNEESFNFRKNSKWP
jgi:hypothetical protein